MATPKKSDGAPESSEEAPDAASVPESPEPLTVEPLPDDGADPVTDPAGDADASQLNDEGDAGVGATADPDSVADEIVAAPAADSPSDQSEDEDSIAEPDTSAAAFAPIPAKIAGLDAEELRDQINGWTGIKLPVDCDLSRDELLQYLAELWDHGTRFGHAALPQWDGPWLDAFRARN